jgi:hypothetical protein
MAYVKPGRDAGKVTSGCVSGRAGMTRGSLYGFGPLDAQAPPVHFRFDGAVTAAPVFFGCVTGGVGFTLPAI